MKHGPLPNIFAARKIIFVGWIMSSPDSDGNVGAIERRGETDRLSRNPSRTKVYAAVVIIASRFEDGEHLSFCNHIVEADEDGFEFARGRRGDRDLHLHGFDEGNVVAIADASAGFNQKRTNTPGDFGHNPDLWHSIPPGTAAARNRDPDTRILRS
jgi:hypothetical protein